MNCVNIRHWKEVETNESVQFLTSTVPNAVEYVWQCTQSNMLTWLAHTQNHVTNYRRGSILKAEVSSTFLACVCFKNCRHTSGGFCHLGGGMTDDTRVPTA